MLRDISRMWQPIDVAAPPEARIARRGAHVLVGVALQGGLRFLTGFLVGRTTNPATLAHVTSGMSLANILALVWPTTAGAGASRFVARARGEGADPNAVARFISIRTLQSAILLGVLSVPTWIALGGTLLECVLVALLTICYSTYALTRGVHMGAGQSARQVRWDLVTSTSSILGVLLVLLWTDSAFLVLGVLGLGYLVYTLACWPWGAHGALDRQFRREIDRFVAWGSLGTLASAGFVQFAMIVAVAVAGRAEAGQFAASMVLAAPAAMIANSLAQVLYPSMAEAFGRGDAAHVAHQLAVATRALVFVMVLIYGVLVVAARPFVDVVWGSEYADAAVLIPLLLVPNMLRSIASASMTAISSSANGIEFSTKASLAGFGVGVLVWTAAAPLWGVVGVAVGYAVGTTVIAGALYIRAWRQFHQPWTRQTVILALAVVIMGFATCYQTVVDAPLWAGIFIAMGIGLLWLVVERGSLRSVLRLLRRG